MAFSLRTDTIQILEETLFSLNGVYRVLKPNFSYIQCQQDNYLYSYIIIPATINHNMYINQGVAII